ARIAHKEARLAGDWAWIGNQFDAGVTKLALRRLDIFDLVTNVAIAGFVINSVLKGQMNLRAVELVPSADVLSRTGRLGNLLQTEQHPVEIFGCRFAGRRNSHVHMI